jgi:hypothetical protein
MLADLGDAPILQEDARRRWPSEESAVARLARVWKVSLSKDVADAEECDVEFVRDNAPPYSQTFINPPEKHRQFRLSGCLFICQLSDQDTCNQLWFVLSSSHDPRGFWSSFRPSPKKLRLKKRPTSWAGNLKSSV